MPRALAIQAVLPGAPPFRDDAGSGPVVRTIAIREEQTLEQLHWSGAPRKPAHDDASPEGHYLQFDTDGMLIAITIVNARWILQNEGKITITLPEHRIETSDLGDVLAAA